MKFMLSENKGRSAGKIIAVEGDGIESAVENAFPGSAVLTIYDKAPQPVSDYSGYSYSVTAIDNGERKETVYRVWLKK